MMKSAHIQLHQDALAYEPVCAAQREREQEQQPQPQPQGQEQGGDAGGHCDVWRASKDKRGGQEKKTDGGEEEEKEEEQEIVLRDRSRCDEGRSRTTPRLTVVMDRCSGRR